MTCIPTCSERDAVEDHTFTPCAETSCGCRCHDVMTTSSDRSRMQTLTVLLAENALLRHQRDDERLMFLEELARVSRRAEGAPPHIDPERITKGGNPDKTFRIWTPLVRFLLRDEAKWHKDRRL